LQKDELTAKYKICDPLKTSVIPLGFDLNRFAGNKEENRKKFRNQYQVKEDEVAIGIIGRLAPIKNHGMFVEVAANVKSLTGKKVRFFIVGDGECLKSVQTKAQQCGLECSYIQSTGNEDIVFTSWRKDTEVVYAGLDMVLLTSLNEGTPVTLIEAQAAGKPVVSTDVGGVRDVTSEKTSRLVPSEDVMGMARKVVDLLGQPLLMQSMSAAGWEETGSRFHYTRLVNDVNLLYSQLLQKSNVRKT
jgi:glycosyltransferase involved in cell wall biosynthesis